ncbi:MAG TPA: DUF4388 domain-containing protein [Thermoanaerobaculia bacterium]|nr:DUF4388 domain-containing protein [Thermoanaerobaculia bacterium]
MPCYTSRVRSNQPTNRPACTPAAGRRALSAGSFQYRGELAETGLPEILHSIDRFQVPGVIAAERAGVVKEVYIKEGRVVHASSSDLEDSLGTHLLRTGRLSQAVFDETMRLRGESDRRYGVLLIEEGVLAPGEVYRAVREQVEAIVWSLFGWEDGAVTFSIGEFPHGGGRIHIDLPMGQVILQGIKRAPDARALVARLGRRETVFEPTYDTDPLIEIALDRREYELLRLVDGRRTLYQVCTEGPLAAADNAKLMYAFRVLQLIRRASVGENDDPGPAETSAEREQAVPGAGQVDPGGPGPEAAASRPVKIRFETPGDRFE